MRSQSSMEPFSLGSDEGKILPHIGRRSRARKGRSGAEIRKVLGDTYDSTPI